MLAKITRLIVLTMLISLGTGHWLAAAAAPWRGSIETVDGIPHVINPAEPAAAREMLEPTELWRVGGEDDDEDHLLGFVTDIQVDEAGNCYLLDTTLSLISVYSSTGAFIRTLGGEGEGPAEFQNASRMILLPGGTLCVLQEFPARAVTLSRAGLPGDHFEVCADAGGLSAIEGARCAGGHIVIGSACANFGKVGVDYSLVFVDASGAIIQPIRQETELSKTGSISVGNNNNCEFVEYWTLAADGRVYISPVKDAYRIEVHDAMGALARVIERDYETLRRSDADLAKDRERQREMTERFGGAVKLLIREVERDIDALHARPGGELWVASSRSLRDRPAGTVGLFDVFDAEGRFMRQVGLAADYDPEYDDYLLVGDLLFILKQNRAQPATSSSSVTGNMTTISFSMGSSEGEVDDEGEAIPPSVICYRLP